VVLTSTPDEHHGYARVSNLQGESRAPRHLAKLPVGETCPGSLNESRRDLSDGRPSADDGVIDHEDHNGPDHRDHHTVEIEARHSGSAKERKQPSPDNRTDDTEDNVENDSPALLVNELAGDEAGDKAQNDPSDDRHAGSPVGAILPFNVVQAVKFPRVQHTPTLTAVTWRLGAQSSLTPDTGAAANTAFSIHP
jgi:hypothetical protein